MRSIALTVAVACALAGGVLAAGWAVQAATLPPPSATERTTARAVAWFLRYRLSESRMQVGEGAIVRGSCLQGWLPVLRGGGRDRGTVLALANGVSVIDAHPKLRVVGLPHGEQAPLPLLQLELGGCPRVLGPRIASLLQANLQIRLVRTTVDGRKALALHVPTARTRLVVYLDPATARPFAVDVASGGLRGHSTIALSPLTPARLRAILRQARL